MKFLNLKERLKLTFSEDRASRDITTLALPGSKTQRIKARLISHSKGVFCGAFLLRPVFGMLDSNVQILKKAKDGARIKPHQVLATVRAQTQAILAGERSYLNLASHLSGIATLTHQFVKAASGSRSKIYDTRKTTPLWRDLEKYAVRCGGGYNHRSSLEEAILIKDNHLAVLKKKKVSPFQVYGHRRHRKKAGFVEMEAKTLSEVAQALQLPADIILLDNMPIDRLRVATKMIATARKKKQTKVESEVSGGITLKKMPILKKMNIDRISIGALTHSAPSLDLSLEVF